MTTFASLFGGGRLADIGAMQAGCDLLWDVELDPAIAAVGAQLPGKTYVCSVTEMDWSTVEKPDILWASPPCPNFSVAKKDRAETGFDRAMAQSVIDALTVLQPQSFILENVEGYRKSDSFKGIVDHLYGLGYWVEWSVLNAADFGVPQTRKRLILRAVKGFVPALPEPVKWLGWYQAIEDLIPTLPESELAKWQLERLPEWVTMPDGWLMMNRNQTERGDYFKAGNEPGYTVCAEGSNGRVRAVLIDSNNTIREATIRVGEEPSPTVTAEKMRRPISTPEAILVDGTGNSYGQSVTVVDGENPSFTVKASDSKQASRAWLKAGQVVRMTSRALARFQTVPDWYELPEKTVLACRIIGNGVPCKLAEQIIASLH